MSQPQCQNVVWYRSKDGQNWQGLKSDRPRWCYRWLQDMNRFGAVAELVPRGFRKVKVSPSFVRAFMCNPDKHRIVRQPVVRRPGHTFYLTLDNGDNPFLCHISRDKFSVLRMPRNGYIWSEDWNNTDMTRNYGFYTERVLDLAKPQRVWIGQDREFPGNSVLVLNYQDLYSVGEYYFVGDTLYRFVTKDDPIEHFYSVVGNNDVPYPVAVSRTRVYFMLDKVWVPRDAIPREVDLKDAYWWFYRHEPPTVEFDGLQELQGRVAMET